MAPPPTVFSLKQDFLSVQTRLLSQPLEPSRAWRTANESHEEGLPDKAVDDALFKLNQRLQQHTRRVYAPQATRHVAEQIDTLYWSAAVAADDSRDDDDDAAAGALRIGADLVDSKIIAALPPSWDNVSASQVEALPLEATRYAETVAQLQALDGKREEVRARVARLERMKALMVPFEDAAGSIQDGLVTRNGPVEMELQKMRMLLARVGGRVSQLKEQGSGKDEERMDVDLDEEDEQKKVGLLLDSF